MDNFDLVMTWPIKVINDVGPPINWGRYAKQFLIEGDSWASIGSFPPSMTTSLFVEMQFPQECIGVNCAQPGDTLAHIGETVTKGQFIQLLCGNSERRWDALFLSAGGNDLIDALQARPTAPLAKRLLRPQSEWVGSTVTRYVSEPGWATFTAYLEASFAHLLASRAKSKMNQATPIFWHTYDYLTPRNAGTGAGKGPWVYKAVKVYGIPEEDWQPLTHLLLQRLAALMTDIAARLGHGSVHVVQTQGVLTAAATSDTGPTLHWQNEIHPTKRGYRTLADAWERAIWPLFWP